MLRWKLKKSVPFEVDETLISYMRQAPREGGVDVVTALGRLRIVREYEGAAEQCSLQPGVVLSASLAAVALLADQRPALLARVSGTSLKPRPSCAKGVLCGYRCTDLPAQVAQLTPQMLLEEILSGGSVLSGHLAGRHPIRARRRIGRAFAGICCNRLWNPNFIAKCIHCCTRRSPKDGFPPMRGRLRNANWKDLSVG